MVQDNLDIMLPAQDRINWLGPLWHCEINHRMLAEEAWSVTYKTGIKVFKKICTHFEKNFSENHSWRVWSTVVLNALYIYWIDYLILSLMWSKK